MKTYIITETNKESNLLLRSWVCFTKEQANECLKKRYDIACAYNSLAGVQNPTDCLEYDFFFWDEQGVRYNIVESKTFAE